MRVGSGECVSPLSIALLPCPCVEFNELAQNPGLDLFPEALRGAIDEVGWALRSLLPASCWLLAAGGLAAAAGARRLGAPCCLLGDGLQQLGAVASDRLGPHQHWLRQRAGDWLRLAGWLVFVWRRALMGEIGHGPAAPQAHCARCACWPALIWYCCAPAGTAGQRVGLPDHQVSAFRFFWAF